MLIWQQLHKKVALFKEQRKEGAGGGAFLAAEADADWTKLTAEVGSFLVI